LIRVQGNGYNNDFGKIKEEKMFLGMYIFIGVIVILIAGVIVFTTLAKKSDAKKQAAMK
jgi:hypothetical protein